MADTNFCHDRNRHSFDDLLNHLRVTLYAPPIVIYEHELT